MIARMLLHGVIAAGVVAGAAVTYSAFAAQPSTAEAGFDTVKAPLAGIFADQDDDDEDDDE